MDRGHILATYDGPSYEDLPMEIILQILSYLNPSDILEAGLTCHRWLEASLHQKFASLIALNFSKVHMGEGADINSPVHDFRNSFRYYTKVMLHQVDFGQADDFWDHFGEHITKITFNNCDLREKVFNAILKRLTNLKSLEINNCRELFMSGRLFKNIYDKEAICTACLNVTAISLCNNRYLSDALFNRVVSTMPNIQSLDLSGCHISFHNGLYRKFYPDYQQDASESVLTFYYISQFIEYQASQLKELNFSGTLIDGAALIKLTEINNLRIEKLQMRSCDQLTSAGICAFVRNQYWLTELDLSMSVRLTDPSLIEICKWLSELKVLKLRRCRAITDIGLKEIHNLKRLHVLDVSECDTITSEGLFEGVLKERNDVLVELYVSALNICEMAIIRIAECLRNLTVLDISFCKNAVTDLGIQLIFKYLLNLKVLNMEFCDKISDAGLSGMGMQDKLQKYTNSKEALQSTDADAKQAGGSGLPQASSSGNIAGPSHATVSNDQVDHPIEELRRAMEVSDSPQRNPYHISLRSRAEEDIVNDAKRKRITLEMCEQNLTKQESNSSQYSITRLRGLRVLNLSTCNRISDVSLKYNFEFLELKVLNLAKCQQISSAGIESFLPRCPSLESVNLSECHNITDKAIEAVTMHLKRLTHLHIERCIELTDYSLDYIALNCKRLKFLDVRGCRSMCSEPNLRLEHIRSLKHIVMSKPGPYLQVFDAISVKRPKAPPLPSSF